MGIRSTLLKMLEKSKPDALSGQYDFPISTSVLTRLELDDPSAFQILPASVTSTGGDLYYNGDDRIYGDVQMIKPTNSWYGHVGSVVYSVHTYGDNQPSGQLSASVGNAVMDLTPDENFVANAHIMFYEDERDLPAIEELANNQPYIPVNVKHSNAVLYIFIVNNNIRRYYEKVDLSGLKFVYTNTTVNVNPNLPGNGGNQG